MKQSVLEALNKILNQDDILRQEPMAAHTTFQVGGPADCFLTPHTQEEAAAVLRLFCEESEPFFVFGNGSNLLVSDEGYRGAIIQFCANYSTITVNETEITAQSGALLSDISKTACAYDLAGMEFASGIPGTLGGAVVMNAGAYDGEMKQIIKSVKLLNFYTGEIVEKSAEEMEFSYRMSFVRRQPHLVLEAVLSLEAGDGAEIQARVDEFTRLRKLKQPLEYPSAGSTFKRPEGYFAGKLIQDSGLRGYTVGGAMISEKHNGFVINKGNATAADIRTLIQDVREQVHERFQVWLEPEVCMLGEDMVI
ncbi:MAG: UDP-N-acetylmuramate dehydrogenase [Lachnospiraceae bacterium]